MPLSEQHKNDAAQHLRQALYHYMREECELEEAAEILDRAIPSLSFAMARLALADDQGPEDVLRIPADKIFAAYGLYDLLPPKESP